mgnify:CR=1 FL=1
MEHDRKKVLVGMSGGIDSSAVCLMLQDEGYEVVGVTMRVWDLARQFTDAGQEYPDFIQDARALAARLGIVHYVADERTAFKDIVVRDFVDEYLAGRTPNPCVMCNPAFKFRVLVGGQVGLRLYCHGALCESERRGRALRIILRCGREKRPVLFPLAVGARRAVALYFPIGRDEKGRRAGLSGTEGI